MRSYVCIAGLKKGDCRPFVVNGEQVGLVRPDVAVQLARFPEVFLVGVNSVELNPAFRDYNERSDRVDSVLRNIRADNIFVALKGWREEVTIKNSISLVRPAFYF
jgi:hypothetical protein